MVTVFPNNHFRICFGCFGVKRIFCSIFLGNFTRTISSYNAKSIRFRYEGIPRSFVYRGNSFISPLRSCPDVLIVGDRIGSINQVISTFRVCGINQTDGLRYPIALFDCHSTVTILVLYGGVSIFSINVDTSVFVLTFVLAEKEKHYNFNLFLSLLILIKSLLFEFLDFGIIMVIVFWFDS